MKQTIFGAVGISCIASLLAIPLQSAHAEFGVIDSLKAWREEKSTLFRPVSTSTREELLGKSIDESCEVIKLKIDERIIKFDNVHDAGIALYNEKYIQLQGIIEKLKLEGNDVSVLEKDLAELILKIDLMIADGDILRLKLESSKSYDCSNEELFKTSLLEVRDAQTKVVEDAKDINSFIVTTVIPDVKEFKK